MKKKIFIFLIILLVIAGLIGVWLYGYHNRKSMDNIPSKEIIAGYLKEQGEEYATEKIEGYSRDAIGYIWDEPDGTLSGLWGEIWETEDGDAIIVYFDSEGNVSYVKMAE